MKTRGLPNLILGKLVERSRSIMSGIQDINNGQPLGTVPKSIKEQLDEWRNMSEQDRLMRLQEWGADKYIEWHMDMSEKNKKSEGATLRAYGVEEEL